MISLELLTKHMAWANQEIYKEVKKLDPEVLDYFVVDKEWTVRTIMVHIVACLLYTSPSPRDYAASRMPSSA